MESDNMDLPVTVLAVYGALVIWVSLLIVGIKKGSFRPFLGFGIALMLVLNVRYFIAGVGNAIAFFCLEYMMSSIILVPPNPRKHLLPVTIMRVRFGAIATSAIQLGVSTIVSNTVPT
jgi:hypothetical protein